MKHKSPVQEAKANGNFWVFGGLLCILLVSIMARDIDRPFTGLHSWAEAHGAWAARVHCNYGLGYTRGLTTWAVGNPPSKNPQRYFDHPQFGVLLTTASMYILGVDESGRRATKIVVSVIALLLLLRILRGLTDQKTALLSGLFCVLFPITGYFGLADWTMLMGFWAIWCYLVLIQALGIGPEPKTVHKVGLAVSLFLALQCGWHGFFYALAIGVHYGARCILRRRWPDKSLLAILIVAPLSSLLLSFIVMAAGHGWDLHRIMELYRWRSAKGEMEQFRWGAWFETFWQHAATNFTLPVLIIAIAYLTVGQLMVFGAAKPPKAHERRERQFPQFWLFIITPVTQLFALKGCLWKHQTWERPFGPFIAIAAALGILLLADILVKVRPWLGKIVAAVLIAIITISCAKGLNHYYSIRHFSPEKVRLFRMLNERIPPDKALLSPMLPIEGLVVQQHPVKGAFYRPEVAWYLDREIVQAATFSEIQKQAQTGRYRYYLVPALQQLAPLINQLQQRYKFESIPADPGGPGQAPMLPYLLFDLYSKASGG